METEGLTPDQRAAVLVDLFDAISASKDDIARIISAAIREAEARGAIHGPGNLILLTLENDLAAAAARLADAERVIGKIGLVSPRPLNVRSCYERKYGKLDEKRESEIIHDS